MTIGLWAAESLTTPEQLYPDLDAILKKAVSQSPNMLKRALDLEMAENNRINARAGLLPNVSASASYFKSNDKLSYDYDNPALNTSNSFTVTKTPYAVSVSQPLYHWGALKNNARIGDIQQSIAQGQYREGYRVLAQSLRAEYLRLIVAKLSAVRARYNLNIASDTARQDEERLAKKVISEADIFPVRINLERAKIGAERTEFDLQYAVRSFARLAGLGNEFTENSIPDSIPELSSNASGLNHLLSGFLAQNDPVSTEAATLRMQIQVENLNYRINKTRLLPKLGFSAGLSQDEQNNIYGSGIKYNVASQYAGISVYWNLFDGFSAKAAASSSLARRRQLESDYRQLTERLAMDAQNQVKQIGFAEREMSITNQLLNSVEGSLRTKKEEFSRGVRSEAEVNQAQLNLYDGQINAYNARRAYLLSIGDFMGTVLDDPVLANLSDK